MALLKELKGSFVGGKISRSLQNRIDLEKFNTWLKEAKNTQIKPEGSVSNRAGTIFVGTAKVVSYRLTINVNVSATIIINGTVFSGTTAYIDLPISDLSYTYSIGASGYATQSGSGTISANTEIDITLVEDVTYYTFAIVNSQGATITINGTEQDTVNVASGTTIEWSVELSGYNSQSGTLVLNEDTTLTITLTADKTITITATPSNAQITLVINNETTYTGTGTVSAVGSTGDSYTYTVSGDNYIQETGSGEITEDTTISVELQVHIMTIENISATNLQNNVQDIATYQINKTGNFSINIKGEGYTTTISNQTIEAKGGTATGTISLTQGDTLYLKAIKGGTSNGQTGCCGIGVWLDSECILAVGGAGVLYGNSGGGYNGGKKGSFSMYDPSVGGQTVRDSSAGYSYNGNTGTNQTTNDGSGGNFAYYAGLYGPQMQSYGGSGYVKDEYSSGFTLTATNNTGKGYIQISFAD